MILDSSLILNNALKGINTFIFNNVFNQPSAEFRTNVKLLKLSTRSKRGTYIDQTRYFELPTQDTGYFVFVCSVQSLFGLIPITNNWIKTDQLNNEYDTCLDVYNQHGLMLSKAAVYVTILNKMKKEVIFAIPSQIFIKFFGNINDNNIYLTMNNPILASNKKRIIYSHVPGLSNKFIEIKNKLEGSNTKKLEVYIDGYNYDRTKALDFFTDNTKYYDLYIDENIDKECTISQTDRKAYHSNNDIEIINDIPYPIYKDIIHIPKDLNPDRIIYTYNEMRIFIRGLDGKGIFISYIAEESISQLTFNDISMPSNIIDAVLDFLGDPNYVIFIKLLKYDSTPNQFIKGGSIIEKMYDYETDTKIIKHFNKEISGLLDVWSGNSLEVSPHIQGLYNYNYNDTDLNQINNHIKVLGYYYYMSLICPQIYEFTNINTLDTIHIEKPIVFKTVDLFTIVYLNGKKIPEENVSTINTDNNLAITFNNVVITRSDNIHVRIFPDFSNNVYIFTPSVNEHSLTILKDEYDVYIKYISSSIDIKTPLGNTNIGYKKITDDINNFYLTVDNGDTLTLNFSTYSYGFTFYLKPKYFSNRIRITDNDIKDFHSLVYDINVDAVNTGSVPVLDIEEIEVYLNGYYLINGLDYKLVKLETTSTGTVSGYQLVITNIKFLLENNTIDIYLSNTQIEDQKVDYVIDNKIMGDEQEEIWQNGLSYFIVDGKILCKDKVNKNGYDFSFVDIVSNGTPCIIKTMIPGRIKEIFSEYEDPAYFYNLSHISNYLFGDLVINDPDTIVTIAYKIFSSYLNEIIKRILSDEIIITASSNINNLLLQLAPYDYLKKYDLVLSEETNNIDLRFVDLYPTYLNRIQTTEAKYIAIRNLIYHYLGDDNIHNSEIVYPI